MNEKVEAYKKRLESQLRAVEGEIALKERSRSRIVEKLKDVEYSFSKELKRGSVKALKIAGVEPVKKPMKGLNKNLGVNEKIEIPTVEMDLPAADAAESKKSFSWSPFV